MKDFLLKTSFSGEIGKLKLIKFENESRIARLVGGFPAGKTYRRKIPGDFSLNGRKFEKV